jgi:two-component system, LytTR family, sensor kinase
MNLKFRIVLYHFLVWLLYYGLIALGLFINGSFTTVADIFYNYLANLPHILAFYLVFFLVLKNHDRGKNVLAFLCLCTIFVLEYYLYWNINNEILPYSKVRFPLFSKIVFSDVLINFLQHFLYAFLYWQFVKRINAERQLRVSQTEKLKTEYNYLKSQINPHFLYNTLDYFYAWMLKHDRKQADGMAILGQLMRYSLAVGDSEGKVKLRDEAEQIENYIQLQQLRFNNKLNIVFKHPEIPRNLLIIPHLLITLVENAFKYGITTDTENPVTLVLEVNDRKITFNTSNRVAQSESDKSRTGIGLENLEKRLGIEYPGKHEYHVFAENSTYRATLNLLL